MPCFYPSGRVIWPNGQVPTRHGIEDPVLSESTFYARIPYLAYSD